MRCTLRYQELIIMPLDYERMLSTEFHRRPSPAIRGLLAFESKPDMISFLAGKPNPSGFPFQSISVTLKPDAIMSNDPKTNTPTELVIEGDTLNRVLQYGSSSSDILFSEAIGAIVTAVHGRTRNDGTPAGDFELSVGTGSQDLLSKTSTVLFNPGDTVLLESPMYPGLLPDFTSRGIHVVNIDTDDEGLSATSLASVLENWSTNANTAHLRFPKALYTVPTGGNPAGTTASADRKREILRLVRTHNVLILEDDPYFYLAFDGLGEDPVSRKRVPSYFALEREESETFGCGYVLRFESFSKILSAGMRVGYVVGPTPIVRAIVAYTASSNIHPSSLDQVIIAQLLKHWGVNGFLQHVDKVATMYRHRRDMFLQSLNATLRGDAPVATWVMPVAGMFFWLKLHLPPTATAPEGDSFKTISENAIAHNVLVVPGSSFYADGRVTPYARASFSVTPDDQILEGLRRLRKAIEATWKEAGYDTIPPMP